MNLFGSSDGADFNAPGVDPRTRQAIAQSSAGAMGATADSERALYQPASTRGLLADDGGGFDKGLGGDPTLAAVRSRSQRDFNHEERRLNAQVKSTSRDSYFKRLSDATDLAAQEDHLNFEREMAKRRAKEAKKQARSAMIGSVLGIVGGVAGGVMGGPAGAMAGMAAGNAGGQMIGNGMGG